MNKIKYMVYFEKKILLNTTGSYSREILFRVNNRITLYMQNYQAAKGNMRKQWGVLKMHKLMQSTKTSKRKVYASLT